MSAFVKVTLAVLLVVHIACIVSANKNYLLKRTRRQGTCSTACQNLGYSQGCCDDLTDSSCFTSVCGCYCNLSCHTYGDCCADINTIGCSVTSLNFEGSCPNEPLMNGMIHYGPNQNSRQVGTIATLRCNNNYGLVPANGAIRVCQNNLLWSGPKPDCRERIEEHNTEAIYDCIDTDSDEILTNGHPQEMRLVLDSQAPVIPPRHPPQRSNLVVGIHGGNSSEISQTQESSVSKFHMSDRAELVVTVANDDHCIDTLNKAGSDPVIGKNEAYGRLGNFSEILQTQESSASNFHMSDTGLVVTVANDDYCIINTLNKAGSDPVIGKNEAYGRLSNSSEIQESSVSKFRISDRAGLVVTVANDDHCNDASCMLELRRP